MGKSFAKRGAKLQQPGGVLFDQFVPILAPEPPKDGFLDRVDGRRARFAREQSHFAEPIPRSKNGDDLRFSRTAFQHDLHGAGLNQVERIALFSLRKYRRSGAERCLFHLAEDFGDILARKSGEDRNTANCIGKMLHGDARYRMTLSALFNIAWEKWKPIKLAVR